MNSLSRQMTNSMLSNHNNRDSFTFKEPNRHLFYMEVLWIKKNILF